MAHVLLNIDAVSATEISEATAVVDVAYTPYSTGRCYRTDMSSFINQIASVLSGQADRYRTQLPGCTYLRQSPSHECGREHCNTCDVLWTWQSRFLFAALACSRILLPI